MKKSPAPRLSSNVSPGVIVEPTIVQLAAARAAAHPHGPESPPAHQSPSPLPDVADAPDPLPAIPFAAVSPAEALAMPLTPAQRTAIARLTAGHTLLDAATAAGVNRTTVYRWLKHDPAFLAAYNAWQADAIATARGRLLALTDAAVTTVHRSLQRGDGRLALKLLERLGIADRPTPGPTDPEDVKREQAVEQKNRESTLVAKENEAFLNELMR